ncbi:hypothetical protein HanRHA438_Chr15g0705001 [Helianthus annuus]|uniref:Uncharacterized protein n=1 Tax=Helianthus annuus TaxID=4232 RepID=A0A251S8E5_HELAN|nr:hypothetical protein HanHA300_Chr15g0564381 [Helianthus annuus]KAJ0455574.1 hypothetical protein HanIR_Chr15g0752721 [Helianthus annuus]KAJ0473027.1 hypothetical protein HanHA89_Chr15g0613671 [Helianthus annuus]KAJ0648629.1 hypothetical protein HanLR1_Chr15g0575041 [Helianthus annuus]KAJ0844666.1 hypothetical protein HanRHA438_Chr15g0705001 [Helianthus annuus]
MTATSSRWGVVMSTNAGFFYQAGSVCKVAEASSGEVPPTALARQPYIYKVLHFGTGDDNFCLQKKMFHNHVVAHAFSPATPRVTGKAADVMLLERLQSKGNELLRDHYVKTELFTAELMVSVKPFTRQQA